MAQDHHTSPPQVPTDMVTKHREGWNAFTHWTVKACVGTAALLFALLLVFKIF